MLLQCIVGLSATSCEFIISLCFMLDAHSVHWSGAPQWESRHTSCYYWREACLKKKKLLHKTTLTQRVISVCQHNCQAFHVWKNIFFAERKFPVLLPGRIFPMWKRWVGNLPAGVMTLSSLHQKHKKCHLRTLPHRSVSGILVFILLCDLSCSRNTFVWKETRWKCWTL